MIVMRRPVTLPGRTRIHNGRSPPAHGSVAARAARARTAAGSSTRSAVPEIRTLQPWLRRSSIRSTWKDTADPVSGAAAPRVRSGR